MEHLSKNIDLKTSKSFYSVPTAKSGIFTTFAQTNKESQIKKSCIEHLPGSYYKVDLAGKLDFVVVFQAIQIERLSVQVQNLRVLLKDSERQVATYLNYEVQIKELTESYHQLQEQLKNYQCELQKMSLACNALYQENSQNKRTFQKQQNESINLIDRLQKENSQLKKQIEQMEHNLRDIAEGDKENQRKNKLISQQLVRLNENLLLGQNQLGELRESYAKKSKQLEKCAQEIKKWQDCARQEKEQTKNNLGQKQQELNYLKNNYQNERKNNQDLKKQLDNLERQAEQIRKQIYEKDAANRELNQYFTQLKTELITGKNQADQLNRFINELKNRIEQGTNEIQKIKQILQTYNNEINNGKATQQQLISKICNLQAVLQQNNQLTNEILQLNAKLGQKEDEIFSKEQNINDLTNENKELFRNNQSLQSNLQNVTQSIKQLQYTLNKDRQVFQSQKNKLTQQFQRLIEIEKQDKDKLQRQLVKVREGGLFSEYTKIEVAALKNTCQKQAKEIQNLYFILQNMSNIIQKLKEKNRQHKQVQKANENLRKQLNSSIQMNQQLIERMVNQLAQISSLMEQTYNLQEKLRNQKDKNDDFMSNSTQKTIISTVASKEPIRQTKLQTPSFNFASSYTSQERYSAPQPQFSTYNGPTDRNLNEKSYSTYQTNNLGNNTKKYSIIGKLDLNSTGNNLSKSVMVNDGVLFESRKVLQPSTYFPSKEGKGQPYKGNLSYRESASSAYEQFKRERRI